MSSAPDQSAYLLLRNQLCHSLYSASNAMVRAYRPLLEPLGLTYPQYLVMLSLWERDDVPIKHLVEETRLDSGTLTPILKRLEQKQLVQRRRGDIDERQWLIQLTSEGTELRAKAEGVPQQLLCMTSLNLEQARALKMAAEQVYQDVLCKAGVED
ncbi:MAG: MarR family winged helix-turn-helix transcriptional regulator [Pseudomonas sp.]